MTNAAWTKTNTSVALDQTGIDGVPSSASRITATAASGTCIQAVTSASASRAGSAYVKRVTGGGAVAMTQDGGATWTTIVPTAAWTRVELATAVITDPALGFRLTTSGDAIAVDYAQLESEQFATSPILTTSAAATRAEDQPAMSAIDDWYNQAQRPILAEYTPVANSQDSFQRIAVGFGSQVGVVTVIRLGQSSLNAAGIVIRTGSAFQVHFKWAPLSAQLVAPRQLSSEVMRQIAWSPPQAVCCPRSMPRLCYRRSRPQWSLGGPVVACRRTR